MKVTDNPTKDENLPFTFTPPPVFFQTKMAASTGNVQSMVE